jgi:hypothetical protein
MSDTGPVRASLVAVACFIRALPLWFRAAPRTPLRVLGIVAFDTLHVLRHSRPLSQRRITELAMFLDFEGCANAIWDRKAKGEAECRATRQWLETAGLGGWLEEYLTRLRALETARPSVGGGRQCFDAVRSYREAVARLALVTAAAMALGPEGRGQDLRAAQTDADVDTLFRVLMQCQIIDDVLDYEEDESAGLPSFLTASASLPQALDLTADAARAYAAGSGRTGESAFPLRLALRAFTMASTLVLRLADRRQRYARQVAHR